MASDQSRSVCPLCGIPEMGRPEIGCSRMRCRTFAAKAIVGLGVSVRLFLRRAERREEIAALVKRIQTEEVCAGCGDVYHREPFRCDPCAYAEEYKECELQQSALARLTELALDGVKYLGRPWVST